MLCDSTDRTRTDRRRERRVITHSSILVLSAFFAGIASAQILPAPSAVYLVSGAAAGVAAWAGLGIAAARRRQALARRALRVATQHLNRRLDRHIPQPSAPHSGRADGPGRSAQRLSVAVARTARKLV